MTLFASPAGPALRRGDGIGASLEIEELAEREPEDAGAAEAQEIAPRHLRMGVTEVGIESTGQAYHGGAFWFGAVGKTKLFNHGFHG
jgi:hypothetical protein